MVKENGWLSEGDLVQVKESALEVLPHHRNPFAQANQAAVHENGWLWIVHEVNTYDYANAVHDPDDPDDSEDPIPEPSDPDTIRYECRSIATGKLATWIRYELNTMEVEDG